MFLDQVIEEKHNEKSLKIWLKTGLISFAIGGLFSVLLVFLRLPWSKGKIPFAEFFKTTLIIHVDLTILVWMMSIICFLFTSINIKQFKPYVIAIARMSFCGMVIMAFSPFTGDGMPLMNNYVPILQNKFFLLGLSIFSTSLLASSFMTIVSCCFKKNSDRYSQIILTIAGIIVTCFLCFKLSYLDLKDFFHENEFDAHYYYEMLFWGGGHMMQFAYTQTLMVIWCIISRMESKNFNKAIIISFCLNFLFAIFAPIIYLQFSAIDGENLEFFTKHMINLGGIAPTMVGLMLLANKNLRKSTPENSCLWGSYILFFSGGFIAILISGSNVTIPAHYHGSTVGISLAFMGFVYLAIPKLFKTEISGKILKYAKIQPIIYTIGQLMHITGLAWSGGYGALRKTPGLSGSIEAKMGLGLMGLGGLFAIIGGLIFVIICFKLIYKKN